MKKKNNKKIILLIIIVVILCMIFSLLGVMSRVSKNELNNTTISSTNELAQIINNLGSKYISECESAEKGYSKDIYLEFKYDLYEDDESKEKIYTNLMNAILVNEKANIRLLDESKDIIIRIIYNEENHSYSYTVNDIENYFQKNDSIKSLNSEKDIKNTELRVNSEELIAIIENDWNSDSINFDGEMNKFNNYDDYFYNGIKVRNIMSKVYNIVFTKNYQKEVINGIEVGTNQDKIIDILGEPTFKKNNLIGYKNQDMYVFFSGTEISIYRNENYDSEKFSVLLSKYIDNKINLKAFMNELTYLWDDYSEYIYSSNSLKVVYPLQGFKIDMESYNDTLGITLYQNFEFTDDIKNIVNQGIISVEDINSFLIAEEERIMDEENEFYIATTKYSSLENELDQSEINKSELYAEYYEHNLNGDVKSVRFFSIDKELPNVELKENVYSLVWLGDKEVLYSIKNKGIYFYNLETKDKQEIISGEDEYFIKKYENGRLEYDNEIVEIEEE